MSRLKIVLNMPAVSAFLLKGEGTRALLEQKANAALQRLGDGYSVNTYTGRNRVNVEVKAETARAYYENLSGNTIIKAVWSK